MKDKIRGESDKRCPKCGSGLSYGSMDDRLARIERKLDLMSSRLVPSETISFESIREALRPRPKVEK